MFPYFVALTSINGLPLRSKVRVNRVDASLDAEKFGPGAQIKGLRSDEAIPLIMIDRRTASVLKRRPAQARFA